jgi:hypothetical protein
VCKICKEHLTTQASSLGKTANSAIHHFDPSLDVQEADDEDESSDKDENSDNYENDHEQNDETKNARAIVDLISQVNAWCRFEGTQS